MYTADASAFQQGGSKQGLCWLEISYGWDGGLSVLTPRCQKLAQTLSQNHWFKLELFWRVFSSEVFKLLVGKNIIVVVVWRWGNRQGAQAVLAAEGTTVAGTGEDLFEISANIYIA